MTSRSAWARSEALFFALGRASAPARHVVGGPGLVDEDQFLWIEIELALEPGLAAFHDVGALRLGRARGFFECQFAPVENRQIVDTLKRSPIFQPP